MNIMSKLGDKFYVSDTDNINQLLFVFGRCGKDIASRGIHFLFFTSVVQIILYYNETSSTGVLIKVPGVRSSLSY